MAGFWFRGPWSPNAQYSIGEAVEHGGQSWRALRHSFNVTPVEGADWATIRPLDGTGRAAFFRDGRPWADVRAWGALTSGTDAAATTAAILTANAFLVAQGGGTLFFGGASSVYLLNATILMRSNIHYKFEPGATTKTAPGVQMIQFLGVDVANVTITRPTCDGNKANQTDDGSEVVQVGIYFYATTPGGVRNCQVVRPTLKNFCGRGINALSNAAGNALEVEVIGARITNCKRGAFIDRPTDCSVLDGRFWGNVWDGIWAGNGAELEVEPNSVKVRGNRVWRNGHHGIVANLGLNNFDISENQVWENGWNGSAAAGPFWGIAVSQGCHDFGVRGNQVRGNPGNITIDPALESAPADLFKVRGVVANNGCLDATTYHGINLNKAEGVSVMGNICDGNRLSGIAGLAKDVSVSGNTLTHNGLQGLKVNAVGGIGSDWTIGANHYAGNGLGDYALEGGPANINIVSLSGLE